METYEEKRAEFLSTIKPGDFVSWTTFDGSSVCEVAEVTDDEIVLLKADGTPGNRWPRSGIIHRDYYGGFDEKLGPAGDTALDYFLRRKYRRRLDAATKEMDAESLEKVAEFAELTQSGQEAMPLTSAQLRQIADLLDAGEEAFRALERITGQAAPLSGGSEVQDTLRAMADGQSGQIRRPAIGTKREDHDAE